MRESLIDPLYQRWRLQTDNGKSKSYRLSLSDGEGAEVRLRDCCMRSYDMYIRTHICASKWLQRIDGKVAEMGVFAPWQKNPAFQCGCSRNVVSDPCTERRRTRATLSPFYTSPSFLNEPIAWISLSEESASKTLRAHCDGLLHSICSFLFTYYRDSIFIWFYCNSIISWYWIFFVIFVLWNYESNWRLGLGLSSELRSTELSWKRRGPCTVVHDSSRMIIEIENLRCDRWPRYRITRHGVHFRIVYTHVRRIKWWSRPK